MTLDLILRDSPLTDQEFIDAAMTLQNHTGQFDKDHETNYVDDIYAVQTDTEEAEVDWACVSEIPADTCSNSRSTLSNRDSIVEELLNFRKGCPLGHSLKRILDCIIYMNNIHTKGRARMNAETLNAIIFLRCNNI